MLEILFSFAGIKQQFNEWNNQIVKFFDAHFSDPFIGYLIFIILLVVGWLFIRSFYSK